jgi:hypothetical protein
VELTEKNQQYKKISTSKRKISILISHIPKKYKPAENTKKRVPAEPKNSYNSQEPKPDTMNFLTGMSIKSLIKIYQEKKTISPQSQYRF